MAPARNFLTTPFPSSGGAEGAEGGSEGGSEGGRGGVKAEIHGVIHHTSSLVFAWTISHMYGTKNASASASSSYVNFNSGSMAISPPGPSPPSLPPSFLPCHSLAPFSNNSMALSTDSVSSVSSKRRPKKSNTSGTIPSPTSLPPSPSPSPWMEWRAGGREGGNEAAARARMEGWERRGSRW